MKVNKRYLYGGQPFSVHDASGTKGILIRSVDEYLFRVYESDGEFIDYEIRHSDLEVTISNDELATFYTDGERYIIDHSPNVLGLEEEKTDG